MFNLTLSSFQIHSGINVGLSLVLGQRPRNFLLWIRHLAIAGRESRLVHLEATGTTPLPRLDHYITKQPKWASTLSPSSLSLPKAEILDIVM